jgi:hypothetical protein
MSDYINEVMKNKLSETSFDSEYDYPSVDIFMKGGKSSNVPTGGFPPLIICDKKEIKEEIKEEEKNKVRALETKKTAISIKEIMEERKNVTQFA